jgi:hypothetical protein
MFMQKKKTMQNSFVILMMLHLLEKRPSYTSSVYLLCVSPFFLVPFKTLFTSAGMPL